MTRAYEIAAALREFSFWAEYGEDADEQEKMTADLYAAADLIENQQRHIEALSQANASLCDSISQLDGANSSLMAANENLAADRKALINELCQYCGKYKQAHEGACDGCRWREM